MIAVETKCLPADQQFVAVAQGRAFFDPLVVEKGAVAAFQVLDKEVVLLADDRRMPPADRCHVERHVAIAVAADHSPVALDREAGRRHTLSDQF